MEYQAPQRSSPDTRGDPGLKYRTGPAPLLVLLPLLLALVTPSISQHRYLVSPAQEVRALTQDESALQAVRDVHEAENPDNGLLCDDDFNYGYHPFWFPTVGVLKTFHRDIVGQWYVAPASGTIDTIFWWNFGDVDIWDSTVYVRVHRSNIGPDYGPGVRPGPWDPPCQTWGYWNNTNDLDQGIAAFREDATDTNWVSTILGSALPSTPPFGEELWGYGGYPVKLTPDAMNFVPMSALGETLHVEKGDVFFISLLQFAGPDPCIPFCHREWDESGTGWAVSARNVATDDPDYPSRFWKFYEHNRGPSNCGDFPIDSIRKGWVARGGFSDDSTDVAMLNLWYSMRVSTNTPPTVVDQFPLPGDTFDTTGVGPIDLVIEDCYAEYPASAGVAGVLLRYSVNGQPKPDVPGYSIGWSTWRVTIPGQSAGSKVQYTIIPWDSTGDSTYGPSGSYRVLSFGTPWYAIDTTRACVPIDIGSTGTEVPPASFFSPAVSPAPPNPRNDGTAGPIDMGADFTLFGESYRFAWIGINGAVSLTPGAADTVHVNRWGSYTSNWTLPNPQTYGESEAMPGSFIAPFWADHLLADSAGQYGRILYGNGGDPCLFIVQWDDIGFAGSPGDTSGRSTFRLVLDRCAGTVEFQYDDLGGAAAALDYLAGMQADSNALSGPVPGYLFVNRNGKPAQTRLRDDRCFVFVPKIGAVIPDMKWNMLSLPMTPLDRDYSTRTLFPWGVSRAWGFDHGYVTLDTLTPGMGFWLKFDTTGYLGSSPGNFIDTLTVPVKHGWNLIGGPSCCVPTGDIAATGTTIVSGYFGYGESGWYTATMVCPRESYWVKVDGDGHLSMSCAGAGPGARTGPKR